MGTDDETFNYDKLTEEERKEHLGEALESAKEDSKNYQTIKLHQITAEYVDRYIITECQIVGESSKKAIPEHYIVKCKSARCNGIATVETRELPIDLILAGTDIKKEAYVVAQGMLDGTSTNPICNHANIHIIPDKGYIDVKTLKVQETIDHTVELDIDLYEKYNVYILQANIPKAKKVRIKAKVFRERKTSNIALIVDFIEPIEEEVVKLTQEDVDELNYHFRDNTNLDNDIDGFISPGVFKRKLVKEAVLLTLFSPLLLPENIRGRIHTAFIGDSKCAKSEISRVGVVEQKGIGDKILIETSSRTGMLYTIDNDAKYLVWGTLPQNDGGFVVLDGMQKMNSLELAEFREVLEGGLVDVKRSVSGIAPARVRLIACLNPKYPMEDFMYTCDSVLKSNCFEDQPDITRWDLFFFFSLSDVDIETIAKGKPLSTNIPEKLFKKKTRWIWSRTQNQIVFTDEALDLIGDKTVQLMRDYSMSKLPMVHNGSKRTLMRVSVAKANKVNSMTDDFESILVLPEHVKAAYDFLENMYSLSELKDKKRLEFEKINVKPEDLDIVKMNDRFQTFLFELSFAACSSPKLAAIMNISKETVKRDAQALQAMGLIGSKQGVGYYIQRKGRRLLKQLKNLGIRQSDKMTLTFNEQKTKTQSNGIIAETKQIESSKKEGHEKTLINYKINTPLETRKKENKNSIVASPLEGSVIESNGDTNKNINIDIYNNKSIKEVYIEEIGKNKNDRNIEEIVTPNDTNSNIEDNGKMKKVATEFIKMSYHPDFINKQEYTLDDMLNYFGTTTGQIKYQCEKLTRFDRNKFIFFEDKFRINRSL